MEITSLDPTEIVVGDRLRTLDRDAVERLKESIARLGIKTPLSVRLISEEVGFALVAGRHRLQAAIELGLDEVPVREEMGTELDVRLWEIAENLHRAELTKLERAEHEDEWLRLSAQKEEEVLRQLGAKLPKIGVGQGIGGGRPEGGRREAARAIGISETQARRAEAIAGMPAEAKAEAKALHLDDNQSALLRAAKRPTPEAQVDSLREHKTARQPPVISRRLKAAIAAAPPLPAPLPRGAHDSFADLFQAKPERALEQFAQVLRDARPKIAVLPKAGRVSIARSILGSLSLTVEDLRPITP